MGGVGCGGLTAGVIAVVTKAMDVGAVTSSIIYFVLCSAVLFSCIVCYYLLRSNAFFKHHFRAVLHESSQSTKIDIPEHHSTNHSSNTSSWWWPYWNVFRQMWLMCLCTFLTFFITLSLFPGVYGMIQTQVRFVPRAFSFFHSISKFCLPVGLFCLFVSLFVCLQACAQSHAQNLFGLYIDS